MGLTGDVGSKKSHVLLQSPTESITKGPQSHLPHADPQQPLPYLPQGGFPSLCPLGSPKGSNLRV